MSPEKHVEGCILLLPGTIFGFVGTFYSFRNIGFILNVAMTADSRIPRTLCCTWVLNACYSVSRALKISGTFVG
ncbi:hypothetical protein SISNIDRAFT_451039 [Sistotremastrum niveocremeum HHB9708]|uniref:Uncharacterized protein n=2 Tax=Sistotremastraceae TaxID=3402574 RepID=A0A164XWD9_9AGAM|nr:hypothetical protein SISNIDRAFT_451039 [Sistotremastrum niveocremeum HHB9708]KZT36166.1 hypothetical protein SISSUDRAFT_1050284 [Sistotremastrum suecicum HHB10207 ss-3]